MDMYNPAHPGEVLKGLYMRPLKLTVTETAKALGVSRKALSELVNGKFGISPDMAIRLAKVFSTTPGIWLNLQQQYDIWQAQKKSCLSKFNAVGLTHITGPRGRLQRGKPDVIIERVQERCRQGYLPIAKYRLTA